MADEPNANGEVQWRHPSGAVQVLHSTVAAATRRKALSRALQAHVDPAALDRSREANALAMANKRAIDTKWRDEERKDDAKAKAQKRADDPEWRDLERDIDAHSKRERKAAVRRDFWQPTNARNALFDELLKAAGMLHNTKRRDASGNLVPLLEPLDLPAAEWVEQLALNCAQYIEFVTTHPAASVRAPNACDTDEWRASLVYDLKRSWGPLSATEASRLESACDDWLFNNAPNMNYDLAAELIEADEMVEKYLREIPAYGKAIRAALEAARDGYEPDACDELRSLKDRSADEEAAAAAAAASAAEARAAARAAAEAVAAEERAAAKVAAEMRYRRWVARHEKELAADALKHEERQRRKRRRIENGPGHVYVTLCSRACPGRVFALLEVNRYGV